MDQLHEELKEPLTEYSMGSEGSDVEDRRDGDRSPSEDEFLSCDSGSSSDRGEGGGAGDGELLVQDDLDGVRSLTVGLADVSPGGVISEKERLKERRVSGSSLRGGSQEMDEDADVDTAASEEVPQRREEEEKEDSTPTTIMDAQNQENNQINNGPEQSSNTAGKDLTKL